MIIEFCNVYLEGPCPNHWGTASDAEWGRQKTNGQWHRGFIRVEMLINGNWHRPPVGIKAEQASHFWQPRKEFDHPGISVDDCYTRVLELVPR